jgi:hypothetical protein
MTFKILTISAALGLAAAGSATAQTNAWLASAAAYSDGDYRASYADARRAAYDNGYREGRRRGEEAARSGRPFDVEREREYRSADSGYNRAYGDRTRYRNDFRGGFAEGYRDGYQRSGGGVYSRDARGGYYGGGGSGGYYGGNAPGYYGGNAGYGAFQNGVADGYRKGLDDVRERHYPDARRQSWYRSGDHDYDKRYGSKDAYKIEYRRGFEEGYERAFREGRRY